MKKRERVQPLKITCNFWGEFVVNEVLNRL